jgi:hypothetical protein
MAKAAVREITPEPILIISKSAFRMLSGRMHHRSSKCIARASFDQTGTMMTAYSS